MPAVAVVLSLPEWLDMDRLPAAKQVVLCAEARIVFDTVFDLFRPLLRQPIVLDSDEVLIVRLELLRATSIVGA